MKTSKWVYAILMSAGIFLVVGCDTTSGNKGEPAVEEPSVSVEEAQKMTSDSTRCPALLAGIPKETLSEAEREDLIFMREEEKLARDVYLNLYDQWKLMPFKNISKSEQVHMDAVLSLLERYDLKDPAAGKERGEFENAELQSMYNDLIAKGSVSALEALKVGALIEEVDIEDLRRILNEDVDNRDIALVYGNLLRGSGHHLKAFTWNLKRRNVEYLPQVLDREVFDQILND